MFLLDNEVMAVRTVYRAFRLDMGYGRVSMPRVVSTVPVDHVRTLCGMSSDVRLPAVMSVSSFFSFSGACGFTSSTLYSFDHAGSWQRLTVYLDFYRRVDGRESVYTGVVAQRAEAAVAAMGERGIESFRRQGGFRYQSTARVATQEAEAALGSG